MENYKVEEDMQNYEDEAVEEDMEYGEDYTDSTEEEECYSRKVWCDYCEKSISQPQYFGNKICCSDCGKVLHEDNFDFIAQQSMKINHETEEIYEEAVNNMARMHIAEEISANPEKSVADERDNILDQSRKIGHETEEIYEEAVDNMARMHIAKVGGCVNDPVYDYDVY